MSRRIIALWAALLAVGAAAYGVLIGRRRAHRDERAARRPGRRVAKGGRAGTVAGGDPRQEDTVAQPSGGWRRQARFLGAEIVHLPAVDGPSMEAVGKHTESDLGRYAYVMTRVTGSLLDVGCGHGIFLDAYAGTDKAGVDIRPKGEHDWPYHVADAASLPFTDASWDTVSAQEMLEHQPDGKMETVLAELRRVARDRLLITVPFCERRLRSGHVQRFDADRVRALFPGARYWILDKGGKAYPWILIEESRPAA